MDRLVDNLMEAAGLVLLVAFAHAVWPPAALLVSGVILIVAGNRRAVARQRQQAGSEARPATPLLDRLVRAIQALRG